MNLNFKPSIMMVTHLEFGQIQFSKHLNFCKMQANARDSTGNDWTIKQTSNNERMNW